MSWPLNYNSTFYLLTSFPSNKLKVEMKYVSELSLPKFKALKYLQLTEMIDEVTLLAKTVIGMEDF